MLIIALNELIFYLLLFNNMKKSYYIVLSLIIIWIWTYYFLSQEKKEDPEYIQEQQKICEEKYASEYEWKGFNYLNWNESWTETKIEIKYSSKEKSCIKEYNFQSYIDDKLNTELKILNLDNWVTYFDCSENEDEWAICVLWCKNTKMKSCYGDVDPNEKDYYLKVLKWDYYKTLKKLWVLSDSQVERLKASNEERNRILEIMKQ